MAPQTLFSIGVSVGIGIGIDISSGPGLGSVLALALAAQNTRLDAPLLGHRVKYCVFDAHTLGCTVEYEVFFYTAFLGRNIKHEFVTHLSYDTV